MSQALLISDNSVINDIYAVNLKAYVSTNITIKKNYDAAIRLLKEDPDLDFIICFAKIDEENTAELTEKFLEKNHPHIPLIVVGDCFKSKVDTPIVSDQFNIKEIIRHAADILEITAKDMASLQVPEFFPIPIGLFFQLSKTTSDVYFRKVKNKKDIEYIKIWDANSKIKNDVEQYSNDGVNFLYVPSNQRLTFINSISTNIIDKLENLENLSNDEKLEIVEEGFDIVAEQLSDSEEFKEEIQNISKQCIKAVANIITTTPKLKDLLNSLLKNKAGYIYTHSMMASYIVNHMLENINWGTKEHAEKINYVLFFHDIFLVPYFNRFPEVTDEESLLFQEGLNDEEKNIILEHASKAAGLISSFKNMPIGADTITLQHHGMNKGEGFASKFSDEISPLAKVIIIAETFAQVFLNANSKGVSDKVNIDAIIDKLSEEKFNKLSYKKLMDSIRGIAL